MYLEKAKKLLDNEYKSKFELASGRGAQLIKEKIRHSYQVLGAGNLILKNEDKYVKLSEEEKDLLKATLLLHDIGRFKEAVVEKLDHGVYGAELLKNTAEFNKKEVWLAIKHHGHLIEDLYEDEEYLCLDDDEKEEVKKYIFLIRDADKIANFYLLMNEFHEMSKLFLYPERYKNTGAASDLVHNRFMKHCSINKNDVTNMADQSLMFFACVFDLNYRASFEFLDRLKIIDKLMDFCAELWEPLQASIYKQEILNYIKNRL